MHFPVELMALSTWGKAPSKGKSATLKRVSAGLEHRLLLYMQSSFQTRK